MQTAASALRAVQIHWSDSLSEGSQKIVTSVFLVLLCVAATVYIVLGMCWFPLKLGKRLFMLFTAVFGSVSASVVLIVSYSGIDDKGEIKEEGVATAIMVAYYALAACFAYVSLWRLRNRSKTRAATLAVFAGTIGLADFLLLPLLGILLDWDQATLLSRSLDAVFYAPLMLPLLFECDHSVQEQMIEETETQLLQRSRHPVIVNED
ncbi:MAG: hypothetical protein MHM6MM_001833 [Cercozoa sp. M6MM]